MAEKVKKMKGIKIFVAAVVSALLFSSIVSMVGTTTTVGEGIGVYTQPTTISINDLVLDTGSTNAFGGGDYVRIRLRDIRFWVLYGNETNPNWITLFTEYTRYFGRAEVYDNQGYFLAKRGIPLFTMLGQRFRFMFEFNDTNGNGLFNLKTPGDEPEQTINATDTVYKILSLKRAWNMSELTNTTLDNDTAKIEFKLTATNLSYNRVRDNETGKLRNGTIKDGLLEKIELYFHLTIKIQDCFVPDVPWYNVTVDAGNHSAVTQSEWLGNENYTGKAVNCSFKYDHNILGWNFTSNSSKLALETGVLAGDATPRKVNMWLRKQFGHCKGKYEANNAPEENNGTEPVHPQKLTRDCIDFEDNWCRIGRLLWESNVTVDGVNKTMLFQVHGGNRTTWTHAGNTFDGFWIFGAYIYPSGYNISHDPGLVSTIPVFDIGREEAQEKINGRNIRVSYVATDIVNITLPATIPVTRPANKKAIGIFADVNTEGTVDEIFVTIKYNDSDVAGIDKSKLKMYYWNESSSQWVAVEDSGVWTTNNTVWANVTHLTMFAPMAGKVSVSANKPTGATINSMLLSWTQTIEPGDFERYEIYRSASFGVLGALIYTETNYANTTYTVTNLSPNMTYYFTVRTVYKEGLYADSSQVYEKTAVGAVVFEDLHTGTKVNTKYTGTGTLSIVNASQPSAITGKIQGIGIFLNITAPATMDVEWAYIEISYNPNALPSGVKDTALRMYYWDGTQWQICNNTGVDTINNVVWANVSHLTIFAPMAEEIAGAPSGLTFSTYIGIFVIVLLAVIVILATALKRKKSES